MSSNNGWTKYKNDDFVFWFKGTLMGTIAIYSVAHEIYKLVHNSQNLDALSKLLRSLKGNFSIVVKTDDWIIAVVDRIRSIPLFYLKEKDICVIGNHAPNLIKKISSNMLKQNAASILEIAMSGYTIGKKTIYKTLSQLTAGEFVVVNKSNMCNHYYYTYSPWEIVSRSEKALSNELTEAILSSIQDVIHKTEGRQIVVPLSAGSDSRLIVSALKHLGAKNVTCFSYGVPGNFEAKISKSVARRLGYDWFPVLLTSERQKTFFKSDVYREYVRETDTLSSIPAILDLSAIDLIRKDKKVSEDAVFVNGNTGDFISGGHISSICPYQENALNNVIDSLSLNWEKYLDKHFSLWRALRNTINDAQVIQSLNNGIKERITLSSFDQSNAHSVYELSEYLGRQSKYIVNMQRSYEFYEYHWMMPLWSNQMLEFWATVPHPQKINQLLYKKTLCENDWGGVWKEIPINKRTPHSKLISSLRNMTKILALFLGTEVWRQFDRNVFQYYLDPTGNSRIVPYKKVLLDKRGQRHRVSWQSDAYLKEHELIITNIE